MNFRRFEFCDISAIFFKRSHVNNKAKPAVLKKMSCLKAAAILALFRNLSLHLGTLYVGTYIPA
jgi:hypothetical protein